MEISPIFLQDLDENLASRLKITVIENFQKRSHFSDLKKWNFDFSRQNVLKTVLNYKEIYEVRLFPLLF